MIRREGELVPVDPEEAVAHVASGFKKIIKKYGPASVAFYGGAANLTEEYYLMNKFMKGAIGSNNVECSTRLCMASTAAGFVSTLGADAPPTCYADIEEADVFFIAGNNMAVSIPVLFHRLEAARVKNGAKSSSLTRAGPKRLPLRISIYRSGQAQMWPSTIHWRMFY